MRPMGGGSHEGHILPPSPTWLPASFQALDANPLPSRHCCPSGILTVDQRLSLRECPGVTSLCSSRPLPLSACYLVLCLCLCLSTPISPATLPHAPQAIRNILLGHSSTFHQPLPPRATLPYSCPSPLGLRRLPGRVWRPQGPGALWGEGLHAQVFEVGIPELWVRGWVGG